MKQKTIVFHGMGIHVYRRESDGLEISIINNEFMVLMIGPKGQKQFSSYLEAQACAYKHGFRPLIAHDYAL